jgi:hypothetical protein
MRKEFERGGEAPSIGGVEESRTLKRLRSAWRMSRKQLQPFREFRHANIQQYVGKHYSNNGTDQTVPVPLLQMFINVVMTSLAPVAPRSLITTKHRYLKPTAWTFTQAVNELIEEIRFSDSIQRVVLDALIGPMGILQTGITAMEKDEVEGIYHDGGQFFADSVDFDDWVHDNTAKRFDQCQFMGNRYRVPLEWAMETSLFKKKARQQLKASHKFNRNNEDGDERVEEISRNNTFNDPDEFRDHVELWNLYLPYDNRLLVVPDQPDETPILLFDEQWIGPEGGPYLILGLDSVPGQAMPLSPASQLMDLHIAGNEVFRKLIRQAQRQKTITAGTAPVKEDAHTIRDADDGEFVLTGSTPNNIGEFRFGGVDNNNMAFMASIFNNFNFFGNNLNVLGGLSPEAETLGQERLLHASANKRMRQYQRKVNDFIRKAVETMAWYEWSDPVRERSFMRKIEGTDMEVPVDSWNPQERMEADFIQFNFDIDIYSQEDRTPAERANALLTLATQILIPMAPALSQQGMALDMNKFMEILARYQDMPELAEILTGINDTNEEPREERPRQSPVTTRRNIRENVAGGATRRGQNNMMELMVKPTGEGSGDDSGQRGY